MSAIRKCIVACVLFAHAAVCGAALPDAVFSDGFELRPHITPLWLPDACDVPAAGAWFESDAVVAFNTSFDANCTGGILAQAGGPDICVVRARAMRIGGTLAVTGTRALALVSDFSLVVDGTIDIAAHGEQS